MAFKTVTYKVRGMKQDISESAFDSDYSFENMNIRIDNRNNNTLLSIEQEMGNRQIVDIRIYKDLNYETYQQSISELPFFVLGCCEIDKYLVLFGKSDNDDYIARLELCDDNTWRLVYIFENAHLNFKYDHPIETLGCVETEQIKKVYFVDGISPLRSVNIVSEEQINNVFLLQASMITGEEVFTITKKWGVQDFYPLGKVQFAFNYETELETKTNLIEISPLFDCTKEHDCFDGDGANKYAAHTFHCRIDNLNNSFKWVNIYIFHWTSEGNPTIKQQRFNIKELTFLDKDISFDAPEVSDYTGNILDLTRCSSNIIPLTMASKDNYLFLGNIKQGIPKIEDKVECVNAGFVYKLIGNEFYTGNNKSDDDLMTYTPKNTTYKGSNYDYMGYRKDNWYKFGIIAQHSTGAWSNVISLNENTSLGILEDGVVQCDKHSRTFVNQNSARFYIPRFQISISKEYLKSLRQQGFVKIKPVCVVPEPEQRTVITQGIACPTIYAGKNRLDNSSYTQFSTGSYFFRPYCADSLVDINESNQTFSLKYSYTLRDVDDLILPNNIWEKDSNDRPLRNEGLRLYDRQINTNPKYDEVKSSLFHFNNPYREYRHGFSLPPKNTINAELELSNLNFSEFYWQNINLFNDDNNPLLEGLTRTLDTYSIQSAYKVHQMLHVNNYKNTIFVDSTINTFNSPEIDFGINGELNYGINTVTNFLNSSKVEVCGYAQITGSSSDFEVTSKKFQLKYEHYSCDPNIDHGGKLAEGYEQGLVLTRNSGNLESSDLCKLLFKHKNNSSSVFSFHSGPFWLDTKVVLRTRTFEPDHLHYWHHSSFLHASRNPAGDNAENALSFTTMVLPATPYITAYSCFRDSSSYTGIPDFFYVIPTRDVHDRTNEYVIYGFRDPKQLEVGEDSGLSIKFDGRILATSWSGELMSTKECTITTRHDYGGRPILTVKHKNYPEERPYLLTDVGIDSYPAYRINPINVSNSDVLCEIIADENYRLFSSTGLTHDAYVFKNDDAEHTAITNASWNFKPYNNFHFNMDALVYGSSMRYDFGGIAAYVNDPNHGNYLPWRYFHTPFKASNAIYSHLFSSAYYFDYDYGFNPTQTTVKWDDDTYVSYYAFPVRPWILPYDETTHNNAWTRDNSVLIVDNRSDVGQPNVSYSIGHPNKYGCHVYMPFSTSFPHAAFDPYYAHALYPFMHSNTEIGFNLTSSKVADESDYFHKRPTNNSTVSFLYSGVTNYIDVPNQPTETKQEYYNKDEANHNIFELDTNYNLFHKEFYYNEPNIEIEGQSQSLTAAMKWYRGFSTLLTKDTYNSACTGFALTKSNFIGNTAFSGILPQLYTKHGDACSLRLRGDYVVKVGSEVIQEHIRNIIFAEDTLNINLKYNLSPHIVFCTKNLNYTLPQSNTSNLYIPGNKFKPEFYYKRFLNEFINNDISLDSSRVWYGLNHITQPAGNIATVFLSTAGARRFIYPHTGTWHNIDLDVLNLNFNSTPYWVSKNSVNDYQCNILDNNIKELIVEDQQQTLLNTNYKFAHFTSLLEDSYGENDSSVKMKQRTLDEYWFLNIVNLINTNITDSPYTNNVGFYSWKECGNSKTIPSIEELEDPTSDEVILNYDEGDTYFQRYNCVKTYLSDTNQQNDIGETASVMIESYINLDGIRKKGIYNTAEFRDSNIYLHPQNDTNIDLINPIYSKQNTLITHREIDFRYTDSTLTHYPTLIMWSSQKMFGNEEDYWMQFPENNMYYASGNNGAIQNLSTFQDQVYCLQEHGFSQLDFNSKALIDTDNANPISITSIEGTRLTHNTYLSDNIGTQNKWSVVTSKYGIYFVDDTLQSIYRFSVNGIEDLSQLYNFKTWTKLNTTTIDSTWNPTDWNKSLVSSYDLSNNDVYFTNKDYCLCFNESLDSFTSFYSYNNTPYMVSYKDKFFAIKTDHDIDGSYLYQNHENYSKLLFDEPFDSYVELLVNADLIYDKVFNFIEYYNDVYTFDDHLIPNHRSYNYLRVYNEYQDTGEVQTDMLSRQKFRLWKTQIPRHNFPNSRDRIRGAWCKVRLINKPRIDDIFRDQLHLISVNYTLPDQPLKQSFSEN